jgi:hypothetical protein
MSAAACLAVAVLVWQTQRPAVFPALPAPPQLATIAPAAEAVPSVTPALAPPSPIRQLVGRNDVEHPQIAQAVVTGPPIDVKTIHVAAIPVAGIAVADLPGATIPVADIAGDDPISVNTIGADAK